MAEGKTARVTINNILTSKFTLQLHMIDNRLKIEVGDFTIWTNLSTTHSPSLPQRKILQGRSEVRQAIHKTRVMTDSDSTAKARQTDGSIPAKNKYIPLESDAEKGFMSRSKVMKRTHGSSRLRLSSGGFAEQDEDTLRRRRGRTAPSTLDSGLSRVHRNQLEELLVHGEDSHGSNSDRELDQEQFSRQTTDSGAYATGRQLPQRSKSFASGFNFPSFGYRRHSQPSSPTETKKVLSDAGGNSIPSSPRQATTSRLARWLSPHVEETDMNVKGEKEVYSETHTSEDDEGLEVQAIEEEGRLIAQEDFGSEDEDDEQVFGTTTSDDDSVLSDGEVTVTGERVTRPEVRESAAEGF